MTFATTDCIQETQVNVMRKRSLMGMLAIAFCIPIGSPLFGQDGPSILSMFRRKPSELTTEQMKLAPEHGPWLIFATALSGDDAEARATMLANEIRREMRLPAFILEKTFDHSAPLGTVRQVVPELDGTTTAYKASTRYANATREKIYAVLVGEFTSTEDPRIDPTLKRIRSANPKALEPSESKAASAKSKRDSSNWVIQKYRSMLWRKSDVKRNLAKGSMGACNVTRNPLLPDDFFQGAKLDDFVVDLNKQPFVKYPLLDNPGRFTVRVASFYGQASTDMFGKKTDPTAKTSNALDRAALQANKLAAALRKHNIESYEFHDRYGSYVMVGSFDELGTQDSQGNFQYNPEMVAIINKFCGYRNVQARDPRTGAISNRQSLNSLEKIPFDAEGKPMAVPKKQTSKLYSNSLLGGR
ncbi:MAG: hypothetical protein AAF483_15715 [Planctomycetota bacterium]